ncbi:MAG: metallophosphoesterase [Armatimonadota bacterium]
MAAGVKQVDVPDAGMHSGIPIEQVRIASPGPVAVPEGFTICIIGDLHAGVRMGGDRAVEALVDDILSLRPDMICLLGDMVHRAHDASRYVPMLEPLEAPKGVYAVLGNHEHGVLWYSRLLGKPSSKEVDEWRQIYADIGVEVLVNEARRIDSDHRHFWLLSVDDYYSEHDNLQTTLSQVEDEGFRLVITHHPDLIDDPRAKDVDCILAGHTHGSQVNLPFIGPLYTSTRRPRARASGLMSENGTLMYVTRGVGESIPLRFRCPREITLVRLRGETC